MRNKAYETAENLLNDALSERPKNPQLLLLKIKLYKETEKEAEAHDLLLKSAKTFPNNFKIMMEVIQLHIDKREFVLAHENLLPWLEQTPKKTVTLCKAAIIAEESQPQQAADYWMKAIRSADSVAKIKKVITELSNTGLPDPICVEIHKTIIEKWNNNIEIILLTAKKLLRTIEYDVADELWKTLITQHQSNDELRILYAQVLIFSGKADYAEEIIKDITIKKDSQIPAGLLKTAISTRNNELVSSIINNLLNHPEADKNAIFTMTRLLYKIGDFKSARRACALLRDSPEYHDKSQLLLKTIDSVLSSTATDSSLSDFHDSIKKEVQKQEVSGSSTTVLIFTGLAGAATVPLKIIHRIISAHGFSAIYLRDFKKSIYLNGITSLADNYPDTLSAIRAMLPANTQRILCMGTSAGGYAAIRYGLDLGADAVLGFGTPTNLTEKFTKNDGRGKAIIKRLNKTVPDMAIDLYPMIASAKNPPRITLWYGAEMPQDKMHAENLRDLDTVELNAVTGCDHHSILNKLLKDERAQSIFDELLSSRRDATENLIFE